MAEVIYATPEELRRQIGKQGDTGTGSDPALLILLGAASRLVDAYYNRPEGFIAGSEYSTRVYKGTNEQHLWINELVEISSLSVGDSPRNINLDDIESLKYMGFRGKPEDPNFNDLPYFGILLFDSDFFDSYKYYFVEGLWGYSKLVTSSLKQIVIAISARYYKQGEGAWSDTLGSSDVGKLVYGSQNADIKQLMENTRLYKPSVV